MSDPALPESGVTVADVNAYFDALERDELWSAVHAAVPGDLRALGIDSAEIRWKAARQYLRLLHKGGVRDVNRAVMLTIAMGFAEENAVLRGTPGWIIMRDILVARARVLEAFGEAAAAIVTAKLYPAGWTREKASGG